MEEFWILAASQFFSGLTRATIYFLIASGLSLIFGVMDVLNFAHGAFYMLGAFLCYSSLQYLPPGILTFFAGVLAGALMLAAIGGIVEFTLLRRNYRLGHVPQILITYGLALVLTDVVRIIWGGRFYTVSLPRVFEGFCIFWTSPAPDLQPLPHRFRLLRVLGSSVLGLPHPDWA